MYSADTCTNYGSTQITVPAGATLAIYVGNRPFEVSSQFKWLSGSSLEIVGVGSTMNAATLAVASGWLLSTTEVFPSAQLKGPANFYLRAPGSTGAVCAMMTGFNQS